MSFPEVAGIAAGIIAFFSTTSYWISILKRKTVPNRATWFILTVVSVIILVSYYSLGARETIWEPIAFAMCYLVTFLLSIKYGEGGWSTFDKWCLSGAGASIVLWWISGSALVALLFNILIDFFGMLPTIKKSHSDPLSEETFPWLLTSVANFLNVLAISKWNFEIWSYPVYMLVINGIVLFFLYSRRSARGL
jgi:hypothetical protein